MKKTLCAVLALALLAGLITALALPASAQGAASDTSVSFHNCDEPVSGTTVDTELKTEGSGSWIVNMGAMMVVYNFNIIWSHEMTKHWNWHTPTMGKVEKMDFRPLIIIHRIHVFYCPSQIRTSGWNPRTSTN